MTKLIEQIQKNREVLTKEWVELTLKPESQKKFTELKSAPSELDNPDLFHIQQDLSNLLDALIANLQNFCADDTRRQSYEAPILLKIKALENTPAGSSQAQVFAAVKAAIAYPYLLWEIIFRMGKKKALPGRFKFEIEEMARAGIAGYDKEQRLIARLKKHEIQSGVFAGEAPGAACSGGSCSTI